MLNPLAQELNETLRGSVVEALMSDMGKRMYFPNGIISQGGEAAKDAYFANGTIGIQTTTFENCFSINQKA